MGGSCDKEADNTPKPAVEDRAVPTGPEWTGPHPSELLTPEATELLCQKYLIANETKQWETLYNSDRNGLSVHAFALKAETCPAPTLLLISDTGGAVFGVYANDMWCTKNRFFGGGNPFLLTIKPELKVYRQTGHNSNFQYFMTGASTLTNGLGVGGDPEPEWFQLFLEPDFRHGKSVEGSSRNTFEAPSLSSQPEFEVQSVELIRLRPLNEREIEALGETDNRSIMTKNKEAVAFQEMAGKKFHTKEMGMTDEEVSGQSTQ